MVTQKDLLNDTRFKIGYEFEFVVRDFDGIMGEKHFAKVMVTDLVFCDLPNAFSMSEREIDLVKGVLSASENDSNNHGYFDPDTVFRNFAPEKLLCIIKPTAKYGWFKKEDGVFVPANGEVQKIFDSAKVSSYSSVMTAARKLKKYWVYTLVMGEYGDIPDKASTDLKKYICDLLEKDTGFKATPRQWTHDDITKTKHGWYLTYEGLEEERDSYPDTGLELISPPENPLVSLESCRKALKFLAKKDTPYKIVTGANCGIHVNVSHEDVSLPNISRVLFNFLFDDANAVKMFGRSKNNACSSGAKDVNDAIRKAVRCGAISLNNFETQKGFENLLLVVGGLSRDGSMGSANFSDTSKYNFVEYRMAGGRNYPNRFKDVRKHVIELLALTLKYKACRDHKGPVANKIKALVKKAGAKHTETFFDDITKDLLKVKKLSYMKRNRRISAAELLKKGQ